MFQKVSEVWERAQAVGLGGLHDGVNGRAGIGAFWCVGEQPVLPSHREGAHSPFRPVVGQLQPPVQKDVHQPAFLVHGVGQRRAILFGTGFFLYSALAQAKNFSATGLDCSRRAWYRSWKESFCST